MTTEERVDSLEQSMRQNDEDRRVLVELTKQIVDWIAEDRERIEQNERQIQQTQRIWIAFARHNGWPEDLEEYE